MVLLETAAQRHSIFTAGSGVPGTASAVRVAFVHGLLLPTGINYLGILLCHSRLLGLGSVRFSVCALYITTEARPFTGP